jgi:S1-C subfamily serine protease
LKRHRQGPPPGKPPARAPQTVDQYPGFAKFGPKSCVHCHHAYDLRREALQENGTWSLEEVWVYPWPENVGWTLAVTPGNRLDTVAEKSLAAAVGMKTGDLLLEIDGKAVATFTDVQHALHKAPSKGTLPVKWNRDGKSMQATLELAAGWRKTDVSWRQSLKGLEPASGLHGEDLSAAEKKQLGLDPKALAFRQGNFPTPQARQAGILQNDIIVGVNKEKLEMTARQFDAHIRLTYQKGEALTIHLLREGKSVELQMRLKE